MERDAVADAIASLASELTGSLNLKQRATLERLLSLPRPSDNRMPGAWRLGMEREKLLNDAAADDASDGLLHRTYTAALAERRLVELPGWLSAGLRFRTLHWVEYLSRFLREPRPGYIVGDDRFEKDFRIVSGMSLPAGQLIDLAGPGLPRAFPQLLTKSPGKALAALRGTWLKLHIDVRYRAEFTDAGWQATYAHMVEIFAARPWLAGMSATSWFYDPAVAEISPGLAYLAELPLKWGAIRTRTGSSSFDVEQATAACFKRRRLHREGLYQPTAFNILWFRKDMLRWSGETGVQPAMPSGPV